MEKITSLQMQTKTIDVAEKGRVIVAVNRTGIEDSQGDISMPGSFDNTLKNDLQRMKWLYNHDWTQLLGVPLAGHEDENGDIVMEGQLNMEKQLCRDVYTDYKLMAEYGRTLEHSVGVVAKKRDNADKRKVHEWMMAEYSTLSFWGANPCTHLIDIKSVSRKDVKEAIEFLEKALKQPEYSDIRLKNFDMQLNLMLKSLNGGHIVTCPTCGHAFDYDDQYQHTFESEVLEEASYYVSNVIRDTARTHVNSLAPQIREQVCQVLEALKAQNLPLTEKSITSLANYVRCPHCWAKVYASVIGSVEEPTTKGCKDPKEGDEEDGKEKPEKPEEEEDDKEDEKKKAFSSMLSNITKKINN